MRPAARPWYRIRQFIRHVTSTFGETDRQFVEKILNPAELTWFHKLPVFEKRHAVDVAEYLGQLKNQFPPPEFKTLQKAALLHDIGKAVLPLNPIEKSIFVILRVLFPPLVYKMAQSGKFPKARVFLFHNVMGAKLLKETGTEGSVIDLIASYEPGGIRNRFTALLSEADEQIL